MDRDQRLIAFCQQAVRIPSPSGQEREVAQLMKRKMEEYGFDEVLIDRHGSVLGRMRGCPARERPSFWMATLTMWM